MNTKMLKSLALGFALGAFGLVAFAVTIPNTFTAGTTISASQVNANFTALKAAVDALEAKKNLPARDGYFAYAWVNVINGAPDPFYASNPAGAISVSSPAVGRFAVTFAGTHPPIRNAQITAYGANTNTCKVLFWTDITVNVDCRNSAGAFADTNFVINVAN